MGALMPEDGGGPIRGTAYGAFMRGPSDGRLIRDPPRGPGEPYPEYGAAGTP